MSDYLVSRTPMWLLIALLYIFDFVAWIANLLKRWRVAISVIALTVIAAVQIAQFFGWGKR